MSSGHFKGTSAWTKFRLLMWKNFLQQWRHRLQTAMELFIPVATMALILILRSQIEPRTQEVIKFTPFPAYSLFHSSEVLFGMNLTNISLAYSPESPVLDDVLRNATINLLGQNLRDFIIDIIQQEDWTDAAEERSLPELLDMLYNFLKSSIKIDAYNSSEDLRGIYADEDTTRTVLAAVEFDDGLYGATELPINISYSLRFPERPRLNSFYGNGSRSWRSELVFPAFELPGPRFPKYSDGGYDPGYVREIFIALQYSISTELISRITGEHMHSYKINLQRYPHPSYVEDWAVEALQYLFPMFMLLSFCYTAVNIVRAVTVEKEMQLKETMKIMGLPTWLHWTAWFCKQFLYLLVVSILIVVLLKVNFFTNEEGFNDYAVFTNTPWTILFFYLILYLCCTIFFCFMISGFFSKAGIASLFAGVIWFLTYIPAFMLAIDVSMSTGVQIITCLSINSAMSYGFQLLLARESSGGMQWGEFFISPAADTTRFTFGHVVVMLLVDCVLYMLIALYFEQVLPGPYGTPQPWYFLFEKRYWFPNNAVHAENGVVIHSNDNDVQSSAMERDPTDHAVGVRINELTKIYGTNIAVNKLSLNIYDDQITVLLGHNGAGKSTTISMLTGNLEITHGSVSVAGYDIREQTTLARAHLGLCPQHNVIFNDLTVREHLEFFTRLKGFTGQNLDAEVDSLIEKLELQDKRDYKAQGLSGGQKRRLCVGIALSGAARVVLLDEPTSGMDPSSRRALWDLLQKEKKGRSMILTTHFMDEADILGDRVAIMAKGRLQCVGTPYFLKRHYGTGYTLVVVKTEDFQEKMCTSVISKYIPGIGIKEDRGSEVTYHLSNAYSHLFEDLLNDLEMNINSIKFKNYGLVATTMEDVFMSVGSDVATTNTESEEGTNLTETLDETASSNDYDISSMLQLNKNDDLNGFWLLCQRVTAVWLKLLLVWLRSWQLILLQVFVPVLQINTTLGILRYVMSLIESIRSRPLTLAQGYLNTETLLYYNGTSTTSLSALAMAAYEMIFTTSNVAGMDITVVDKPIDEYYLDKASVDSAAMGSMRHRVLAGASFAESGATAWFSNFGYHDAPTTLAALQRALLRARKPDADIHVYNHPLEANYRDQRNMQIMIQMLSMNLASNLGSSLAIVSCVFIMFYIRERVSGAKLLQKAAGIQPIVMWGSAAIFDWLWFLVISVTVVISCAAFQVVGLSSVSELGRMYLCLMVYAASIMPLLYLFSNFFKGPAAGFVIMFFIFVLFGTIGPQIVEALSSPQLDTELVADILDKIFQFFPLYSLVTSVRSLNQIGLTEYTCLQSCEFLTSILPDFECSMQSMCEYLSERNSTLCCVRDNVFFEWEQPGVLRYIVCMLVTCVVMWIVLMLVENRVFHKLLERERKPPPVNESELDADVLDEARHASMSGQTGTRLVTTGLSKYYRNHLAVDQLSFTVGESECFGLLGVNGAGKTTTFKMLMGDESVSSGEAYVCGYSVKKDMSKVYQNIGYCPQFDAVFNELTGRENLRVFAMLRGMRLEYAELQTVALADALGFLQHLDKKVSAYSGGNKRKLSTAVALAGRARLVFADEPTTGVDPAARRRVWRALQAAARAARSVLLTSHSMEECEALCSRLTIMVNGRFHCLGTPQHLKNKFSQGFTLVVKIKMSDDFTANTSAENTLQDIKEYIHSNFTNPKLMEEYKGLLTYYLPDRSVPWSTMFKIMEKAKRELGVEDYSISQTTLEQIFLQFTKYQR